MVKREWKEPAGEIVKKGKTILNAATPSLLDACVITLEKVDDEAHYILNFTGVREIRIVGRDQWEAFVEFLHWFDWNPEDTEELDFHAFEEEPYGEEVWSNVTITDYNLDS